MEFPFNNSFGFKKVLGHLSINQQEKEINAIFREIHRRTESVSETNNITHYTPNSELWTRQECNKGD